MAKSEISEQLKFLWTCTENSQENSGKIDFKEVAAIYGIKVPAARMRFHRLGEAVKAQAGNQDGKEGESAAGDTPKKGKARSKGKAAGVETEDGSPKSKAEEGVGKGKKRKIEDVKVFEDGQDVESGDETKGKKMKAGETEMKAEEEEEQNYADYDNGGIDVYDENVSF